VTYLTPVLVFIISYIYLFFLLITCFSIRRTYHYLCFSGEYLHQFGIKPGGLLEYTGNFLSQFFFNSAFGALIVSASLTLIVIVGIQIIRRLSPEESIPLILVVIPVCLLLLMQINSIGCSGII